MELSYIFVRKYNSNREISLHAHDIYEFVYYFSGEGYTTCGNENYTFGKDSYAIIPPSVMHNERHIGKGHILAIGFSIDDEAFTLESKMYNGFNPKIYSLTQKLKIEFIKKEEYYEETIKTLLKELTIYLKRSQKSDLFSNNQQHKDNDIYYAITYLNEYFMTDIDLTELAQSTGYCKDHFRILFKKHTGKTPKAFILDKKLAYAKKLLENPDTPLTDIATQCGFEYYSCFCGFFKKKTGLTPLQFRNKTMA